MTTAALNGDGVRTIQGRKIERHSCVDSFTRERYFRFMEVDRPPPIEKHNHNAVTGDKIVVLEYRPHVIRWDSGGGPGEQMRELLGKLDTSRNPNFPTLLEFDPREPSPIHDEMERAVAGGFPAWGAQLAAQNKIGPRAKIGGFGLGTCWLVRGVPCDPPTIRRFVAEHANQKPAELDDDSRWCPLLGCPGAENGVAIESGSGLVRSRFEHQVPEVTGGVFPRETGRMVTKNIHVWTLLASDPGKIMTLIH
jgi:hypothetical protein